jgi:NAD(P)-dependent dehydrogenase (short-subunit alcohol dehydrogenase family)
MSAERMGESWGTAGRIVLVTGAGEGLGKEVALALAAAGTTVIASSRRRRKLEALDDAVRATGNAVTLLPLDLAEPEKLIPIGPSIYERFGRLDAVVHCAAVLGTFMPTAQLDPAMLRETITVNALATQALIATLDPLLQAAPDARASFSPIASPSAASRSSPPTRRASRRWRPSSSPTPPRPGTASWRCASWHLRPWRRSCARPPIRASPRPGNCRRNRLRHGS